MWTQRTESTLARQISSTNFDRKNDIVVVAGNTFQIFDFESRNGTFTTINGTGIGGDLMFDVAHNTTDVTLSVVPTRALSGSDRRLQ